MKRMIWAVAIAALLLATMATGSFAYRLIATPIGQSLPDGMYKLEIGGIDNTGDWTASYRFDGTVLKRVEIGLKSGCAAGSFNPDNLSAGFGWQLTDETDTAPGVGVGIWNLYDSTNNDAIDTSLFISGFKTVNIEGLPYPVKLHLGVGSKQLNGIFGGVAVPLSKRALLGLELGTNGVRPAGCTSNFNWGVAYNQNANWCLKYRNIGGANYIAVAYTSNMQVWNP